MSNSVSPNQRNISSTACLPHETTTFDLYNLWKELHFRKIGHSSINNYLAAWKYLQPELEARHFSGVRTRDFQRVIDSHCKMSYSTLHKIKQLCRHLCNFAIMEDLIRVNYADFISIPANNQNEIKIFTDDEIVRLLEYGKNKTNVHFAAARIVSVLIFTGFRPSELFSITRENTNLKENFFIGGSKTAAGKNRIIPIISPIRSLVAEWYLATAPSTIDNPSYLIMSTGKCQVHLGNWRRRHFYPLMQELGINLPDDMHRITPYSSRHTFASLCYRVGVQPETMKKVIGHTSFEFTAKTYVHPQVPELHNEISKLCGILK